MGRRGVWAAAVAGMLALPGLLAAQDRQISGTVTRAGGGQPIPEATITQVGGRGIARSNSQGRFTITVSGTEVRLAVRAIGYTRRELVVPAGLSTVEVPLTEDVFKLDEVVTTGQATTLEKRNATTATVTVSSDEVTRAPAASIEQALQGKVPGAVISMNGGQPGGGGQIQIRGVTSILGSGQPLIVVDGVIFSNEGYSSGANAITGAGGAAISSNQDGVVNRLADLNPNEIESIEVLKSATATAIYGSRATNGVVVIKTKHGEPGKPRFTFTQRVGTQAPLHVNGPRQFTSVADILSSPGEVYYGFYGNQSSLDALNAKFPDGTIPASAYQNYFAQFYGNRKPSYDTQASMSGGSETLQYFVSVGNKQENGLADFTGARLQSLRANVDQTWSSKFRTSASFNVTRNTLDRGLANNDNSFTSPIYAFGYTPAVFVLNTPDANGNYPINPTHGGGNGVSNPFQTFANLTSQENVWRQTGSISQSYLPLSTERNQVTLTLLGGLDRFQQSGKVFSPGFLQYEGSDGYVGRAVQSSIESLNYNTQLTGAWTFSPSKSASFNTSIGASYERQQVNTYRLRGRGLPPGSDVTNVAQAVTIDVANGITEFRDQALFANEQILALDNKLAINGGVRADRSSANGDPGKFYVFPRASASYNIGGWSIIDNVKVRGGWGQTGNRPNYGSRDITYAVSSVIDQSGGIVVNPTVGNPLIRPETLTETEGGLDLQLFRQKLQLEGTYYKRNIGDQLLQPAYAPSTGNTSQFINGGKLRVEGFEGSATIVPVNTGTLQWTTRATFQKNKQRVVSLPDGVPAFNAPNSFGATFGRNRIVAGQLATAIWGFAPVDATTRQIQPVGCSYVLSDGFAINGCSANIARADTIIGDANPDFQMFFNNSITFKRVTLAFTVDWRKGGDVSNMTLVGLQDDGGTSYDFDLKPTPGIVRGTTQGIIDQVVAQDAGAGGSKYGYNKVGWFRENMVGFDTRAVLQDGGFVRLRDVSLSYDTPPSVAGSLGAKSLRLNLQARNVLLFTKYRGFDPEFNNFGNQNLNRFIDLAPYPGGRQFYISVDVGF